MEEKQPGISRWSHHRDDLTGEHPWGDAGQALFAVLFFAVWILDGFFLNATTRLNEVVPGVVRIPVGAALLVLAAWCAGSGLKIVFGRVRETPAVIREGVLGLIRHPMYFSEVLLYLGLFLIKMSWAAGVAGAGAAWFLYFLSRYEERLLLDRFGDEYRAYMKEVGMWIPNTRRR